MKLRQLLLCLVLLCLIVGLVCSDGLAQVAPVEKEGTIKSIQQKGRLTTLEIEDTEGNILQVPVTPRTEFEIVGTGDAGFVTPGQFIDLTGVLTNERLYTSSVKIVFIPPGKRSTLRGRIAKAPAKSGQSVNAYLVSGNIVATQPDPDFEDYTNVMIQGSQGIIMLEKNFKVTVAVTDPAMIPEGAKVTLTGKELRGGKFNTSAVTVHNKDGFDSTELLASPE